MPALIPTNTLISKNNPRSNIQTQSPQSPQSPPQQPPYKISPSDDKLHKDLDEQVSLIKQIQQILEKEQTKLKMMLTEFHTRNSKRKQIIESHFAKGAENENIQAKRRRICSPTSNSIHGKLSAIKSDTKIVEKQIDKKNPVDKLDSSSNYNAGGSSSSPGKQRRELETFRNFWSSCNDVFEDEEIDIKEERNPVVIEDLVMDEMDKRRQKVI